MHVDIVFSHLLLSLLLIHLTSLIVEYDPVTVSKKNINRSTNFIVFLSYHINCYVSGLIQSKSLSLEE